MLEQDLLDGQWVDVVAAADDDVLGPPDEPDVAVLGHAAEVAGTATSPELGMLATAGCVLAFLTRALDAPGELQDEDADALAEMLLRMLGMSARSAADVAHRPLPPT